MCFDDAPAHKEAAKRLTASKKLASCNDAGTLDEIPLRSKRQHQAVRDFPNLKEWMAAIGKEIQQLQVKNCWAETTEDEALAAGKRIVPCTQVLRAKRNPAGEIVEMKAWMCLRGDLMSQDKDNHAPAVAFSTV